MSQRTARVYLSFSTADAGLALHALRPAGELRAPPVPTPAVPLAPRPARLNYIVDADGRIKYVSAYTAAVLMYREGELLGMSAIAKLRPDLDETFRRTVLSDAQAHPDKWCPMPADAYVLAQDEHPIVLLDGRVRWSSKTATLLVEGDVPRADDERVRRLGAQFDDPLERERMASFFREREQERAARLEQLLARAEQQFADAKPGEGGLRRYPDPDELERDLHVVFDKIDPWTLRVSDVCRELPRKITPNSLRLHFERFGWLKRGSLKESLRDMAWKYANDQGRGLDHLGSVAALVALLEFTEVCSWLPHALTHYFAHL